MRVSDLFARMAAGTALAALTSCGGGGASSAGAPPIQVTPSPAPAPTPTPTVTPTPAPTTEDVIILAAAASQTFAAEGRYTASDGGITVSFDAALKQYFVVTPGDTSPRLLQRDPTSKAPDGTPQSGFVLSNGVKLQMRASGQASDPTYRYLSSNLATWGKYPELFGVTAFGIATPAGALPHMGSVTYSGFLEGWSTERYSSEGSNYAGTLDGAVSLTFDFATGTATIIVTPRLGLTDYHALPTLTSAQLVVANGTAAFHQPVFGDPASLDFPISGRFTGMAAEELIGGIRFEYTSPIDGRTQTIGAAFIAKRTAG